MYKPFSKFTLAVFLLASTLTSQALFHSTYMMVNVGTIDSTDKTEQWMAKNLPELKIPESKKVSKSDKSLALKDSKKEPKVEEDKISFMSEDNSDDSIFSESSETNYFSSFEGGLTQ